MQNIELIKKNMERKLELLDMAYEVADSQTSILADESMNVSVFDGTVDELELYTKQLSELDEEAEPMLRELQAQINFYKANDPEGLNKIRDLSDKIYNRCGMIINILGANREKIDGYLADQRKDVSSKRRSVAGIRGYFRSMGGLSTDSRILDNKV